MLSDITDVPYITFMIKGVINSGKSTLFNAIFSRNISKTSMKRQTMCNVILSEDPYHNNQEELKRIIESENQRVYDLSEKSNAVIQKIEEIYWTAPLVENFLKRISGVRYRFVESVGFDDPKTDNANKQWFKENTKWADIILFVTDKEKCMNTNSEQNLFRDTVNDIKSCLAIGKSIFLIVVINKVEDKDDDEVQAMINQCRNNVNKIINELGANEIKYGFSIISAMNCLYYRLFMRNYSFEDMEVKDITRLAELELGRSGRDFVKNPSDRIRLAELIKTNLTNDVTHSKWQTDCGINDMINFINTTILSELKVIFHGQKNVMLDIFKKELAQPNITWEIGFNLIRNYVSLYKQMRKDSLLFENSFIRDVIAKCLQLNAKIDIIGAIKSIYMTSESNHSDYKKVLLHWKMLISDSTLQLINNLWYDERVVNNKSFINHNKCTFQPLKVPVGRNTNNRYLPVGKTSDQFKTDLSNHYKNCVNLTYQLSQLDDSIYSHENLFTDIIIPIIIEVRKVFLFDIYDVLVNDVLVPIEDLFLPIAVKMSNDKILQQFCKQLLISKIHYRDSIPGYGLLLKEVSISNIKFRETYYFSLVPILYQVSDVDKGWAMEMANTEKTYHDELVNHKNFKSEKHLL